VTSPERGPLLSKQITIDRDVYYGILCLLLGHILDSFHDDWLHWWILMPMAATAQTMGMLLLLLHVVRRRRKT